MIDLSKQQIPDADSKAIQQTNFTANQVHTGKITMFLYIKKDKKQFRIFLKEL